MSIVDLFEDPGYIERRDAFFADIGNVEKKNISWFKARSGMPWQDHDILANHYEYIRDQAKNTVVFGFRKPEIIPDTIMNECRALFSHHFGDGNL